MTTRCQNPKEHSLRKSHGHGMDRIGIAISFLCLVHCLLGPILVMGIPWLGQWVKTTWAHLLFFLLAVPVAFISFYRSYHHHRQFLPIILGSIGVTILAIAVADEHNYLNHVYLSSSLGLWADTTQHIIPSIGGLFIIVGHYLNIKNCGLGSTSGHCH